MGNKIKSGSMQDATFLLSRIEVLPKTVDIAKLFGASLVRV